MSKWTITPEQAGHHEIRALRRYVTDSRGPCEMGSWLLAVVEALEAGESVTGSTN